MTRTLSRPILLAITICTVVIGFPSFATEAAEVPEVTRATVAPEATRELTWIGGQAIALGGPAADALYAAGGAGLTP